MSDSFLYQPHVHGADGVLTPDLVVDNLAVVLAPDAKDIVPLPINLLTGGTEVQQASQTACGSAALVVIAAGRGAVVTVGSDHWDPELGPPAALGRLTCAKPIAREAVRLETVDAEGRAVLRTFRLRGDNQVQIGETSLGDMPPVAEIITEWSGSPKSLARSALFIGTGHRDDGPGQAEGYRVELELPGSGRCLAYTYGVRRL
jgi:hypothetical protein